MKRVVVDASALVEYLFRTPRSLRLIASIEDADNELQVPSLADIEVSSAIVRLLARDLIAEGRAVEALTDLADLPLVRHGHLRLLPRIVALRHNFSAYDATYVALAEELNASLITADDKLSRAVREHTGVRLEAGA